MLQFYTAPLPAAGRSVPDLILVHRDGRVAPDDDPRRRRQRHAGAVLTLAGTAWREQLGGQGIFGGMATLGWGTWLRPCFCICRSCLWVGDGHQDGHPRLGNVVTDLPGVLDAARRCYLKLDFTPAGAALPPRPRGRRVVDGADHHRPQAVAAGPRRRARRRAVSEVMINGPGTVFCMAARWLCVPGAVRLPGCTAAARVDDVSTSLLPSRSDDR